MAAMARAEVLFAFAAEQPTDLALTVGDVVEVTGCGAVADGDIGAVGGSPFSAEFEAHTALDFAHSA